LSDSRAIESAEFVAGRHVAVIGGGPAGLMAAEALASGGCQVDVYDAMPSVGRKFLLAGIGGLNLTHSEPFADFVRRYGDRQEQVEPSLRQFGPDEIRTWALGLGIETFVGTSARVFPRDMKAAPLLRAWLHRLRGAGVRFHMRHRWLGWGEAGSSGPVLDTSADDASVSSRSRSLRFASPQGEVVVRPDAVVLALGGGSWARLGSDGAWVPWLQERGVDVARLKPANCGFDIGWSEHFRSRQAGQPVKPVALSWTDPQGQVERRQGEFVITETGVEGSLIYAFSGRLRDQIEQEGSALIELDLLPSHDVQRVLTEVAHPRGSRSLSSHLKSRLRLQGVKSSLIWEVTTPEQQQDPATLARLIKALPLTLKATRPIDEAISSAGGVRFDAMTEGGMLRQWPGVFCAGEMTDWEAPTGGYLLTECLASGRQAGLAAAEWLGNSRKQP